MKSLLSSPLGVAKTKPSQNCGEYKIKAQKCLFVVKKSQFAPSPIRRLPKTNQSSKRSLRVPSQCDLKFSMNTKDTVAWNRNSVVSQTLEKLKRMETNQKIAKNVSVKTKRIFETQIRLETLYGV